MLPLVGFKPAVEGVVVLHACSLLVLPLVAFKSAVEGVVVLHACSLLVLPLVAFRPAVEGVVVLVAAGMPCCCSALSRAMALHADIIAAALKLHTMPTSLQSTHAYWTACAPHRAEQHHAV